MAYYSNHLRTLAEQIESWQKKADSAKEAGNLDAEKEALEYVSKYQKMLQEFELIEVDDSDEDPFSPSRVPTKPRPNEGAGSVALPMPEEDNESD